MRLTMFYIAKCWVIKRQHAGKASIVDFVAKLGEIGLRISF